MLTHTLALLLLGAPPPTTFGDAGTISPNGLIGVSHTTFSTGSYTWSATNLRLAPRLDYFVVDDFTVAASVSSLRDSAAPGPRA